MNYHGRMMNLPLRKRPAEISEIDLAYKYGHRDARHAAAEIAIEADKVIADLLAACERALVNLEMEVDSDAEILSVLRADIAKAKGEES